MFKLLQDDTSQRHQKPIRQAISKIDRPTSHIEHRHACQGLANTVETDTYSAIPRAFMRITHGVVERSDC